MTTAIDTDTTHQIRSLAIEAGMDAAAELANEGADAATLEKCGSASNDWGTSSSEAWYHQSRREGFRDLADNDAARTLYCEEYECAARARCRELAAEVAAEV